MGVPPVSPPHAAATSLTATATVMSFAAIVGSCRRGEWCSSPRSVVTTYAAINTSGQGVSAEPPVLEAAEALAKRAKWAGRVRGVFRYGGRILIIVGIAADAWKVYHARDKVKAVVDSAGGWAGATAGPAAFAAWFAPGDAAGPWAWAAHGVGTLIAGGVGYWAGSTTTRTIYELAVRTRMPIPRDQIIEMLDVLAGPLGPQTSLDERLERQDRWVAEGGVELLEALLEVVASPPLVEHLRYASRDDWNTLLIEVAGALGKRYPDVALQRLVPLLDADNSRATATATATATAIDILGSVGDVRAVPRLGQLMHCRRLGQDDLVRVAGALGEIGGDEACRLLAQLRQAVTPAQQELRREIYIAVQVACCG